MRTTSTILAAASFTVLVTAAAVSKDKIYDHVIAISVDGFHSSDVAKYVAKRPGSAIAKLLETGYEYTNAYTTSPSDSFPGILAQYTGAGPATTGVWYDNTWDRSLYPIGSDCKGPIGANALFDETIEYNSSFVWSGTPGHRINPANLPLKIQDGACVPVYPHNRLRVTTTFEIAHAHGMETAYTDKHEAYDLISGPSGKGLSVRYFPEMTGFGGTVQDVINYDSLHVAAWLDWIDGVSPVNASGSISGMPALMGGNFQCVSVAQKTVEYNTDSSLSTGILQAMDFVDASLGKIVAKLQKKGLYNSTLIVVASKHGQSPIDPKLWNEVDPQLIANNTGVPTAFITTDDIALIFLNHTSDTVKCAENLMKLKAELKIMDIWYGANLTTAGFGDPKKDPAVPDIIIRPEIGTCYTTSKAKTAEHGGLSDDDRKVACFFSNPGLKKSVFGEQVSTKQVAPTILKALGLPVGKLQGAVIEGTQPLAGFRQ